MPLFEYHCNECQTDVELLVRNEIEDIQCSHCGSRKLEKQMSVAAAPQTGGNSLPVCEPSQPISGCGRPQCGSGCMFE
ncbi:MAG: zinc ribbon domain-containing protein [Aureliella sp.]